MEARLVIGLGISLLLFASCKKQTAGGGRNYNAANPATEGALLTSLLDANDSVLVTYQYDDAKRMTVQTLTGNANLPTLTYFYHRDAQERITQIVNTAGNTLGELNVHYVDASSGMVAYTQLVNQLSTGLYTDSETYTYNAQNYVEKISIWTPGSGKTYPDSYDSFTYDPAGNLKQYMIYDSAGPKQYYLNLEYQFEYDSAINPLFSYDDARLSVEWVITSPNNVTKQTNIYGNPPLMASDYITYFWQYRPDNKPASETELGSEAIPGTPPGSERIYSYQ
jgi:hypothetical protein